MSLDVLIVEPYDVLRAGLRSILTADPRVRHIHELADDSHLLPLLHDFQADLLVINQGAIPNMDVLPRGRFVVLTQEPDMGTLREAYLRGALGYFSVSVSAGLLRMALNLNQNAFLLEPLFVPSLLDDCFGLLQREPGKSLLTAREQEIASLMQKGIDRVSIAQQLCITEATLKTHLRNIARKVKDLKEKHQVMLVKAVEQQTQTSSPALFHLLPGRENSHRPDLARPLLERAT